MYVSSFDIYTFSKNCGYLALWIQENLPVDRLTKEAMGNPGE
jgi:hypothetical protein